MSYGKVVLLLLLTLCLSVAGWAQPAEKRAETKGQTSEADRARFDELRAQGFEALYNLDYEGARRKFKELSRLFPEHPAGPQFLAATLWTQTLYQSRRLQASVYNTESFYAKNEDKVDPQIIQQFRELIRQAKQLAEARLKRNARDTEALYYLGAIEGLKAAFAYAVERRFVAAALDGSRSADRHRDVVKLDPSFHDAEVTIGIYDYTVGGLTLPLKIMVGLTGARGSKKRGLETLERVTREGKWARDDARIVLIALYKREGRFADAVNVARELGGKYPRNYLFKLEMADALASQASVERKANRISEAQKLEREAFNAFDSLLLDRSTRESAARLLDLIHFQYGEALLVAGQPEAAAKEYLAAAAVAGADAGLATMARLRAAQAYDLAGKRNEALTQYKVVLERPNIYDAHDEAKQGLREPYKPKNTGKNTTE
ncbi:MAG TPA: hypothetical protein VF658_03345 [Pyrinomonadaceae bacterium]|jgi:hypothetical protein